MRWGGGGGGGIIRFFNLIIVRAEYAVPATVDNACFSNSGLCKKHSTYFESKKLISTNLRDVSVFIIKLSTVTDPSITYCSNGSYQNISYLGDTIFFCQRIILFLRSERSRRYTIWKAVYVLPVPVAITSNNLC